MPVSMSSDNMTIPQTLNCPPTVALSPQEIQIPTIVYHLHQECRTDNCDVTPRVRDVQASCTRNVNTKPLRNKVTTDRATICTAHYHYQKCYGALSHKGSRAILGSSPLQDYR